MVNMSPKYVKYVKGFTKHLRHPDVTKRRRAARMVGELGAAEAIEQLQDLVEHDPDPIVRKNAMYSLGMFAAFRDAVESTDEARQAEAIDALTAVMQTAKIGKRSRYSPAALRRMMIGLGSTLVILLAVNAAVFFLTPLGGLGGDGTAQIAQNTPPPDSEDAAAADQSEEVLVTNAQAQLDQIELNADKLEALYQSASDSGTPVMDQCLLPYTSTEPLLISEGNRSEYPQIASLYDEMAAARETFMAARARIEQACFDEIPLEGNEAETTLTAITTFQSEVESWRTTLSEAIAVPTEPPTPTVTTAAETAAPSVTENIQPTPAPTQPVDIRPYIADTRDIIDRTGIQFVALESGTTGAGRGPAILLEQYWQEAINNEGVTDGCRNPNIQIDSDYVPPNPQDYERTIVEFPGLDLAVTQMNAGLEILRNQARAFEEACAQGPIAVRNGANSGLEDLAQAKTIMLDADAQLADILESQ